MTPLAPPALLICLLHLQYLRLDAFDGLADLCAQSDLPYGEFPKGHQMLFSDANYRGQDPSLVLGVLAIEIAPLTFKRIHQQIGDLRPPKIFQWAIPLSVELGGERDLELLLADRRQRGLVIVKDEVAR